MKKVAYIIGDIHGCLTELESLEEKIEVHARNHQWSAYYVSVGDLVDRGPQSAAVVEHWRQKVKAGRGAVVMGNHESMFLRLLREHLPKSLKSARYPPFLHSLADDFSLGRRGAELYASLEEYRQRNQEQWLKQGGYETLLSYGVDAGTENWQINEEHLSFLTHLPLLWEDEKVIVSHAFLENYEYTELKKQGYIQFKEEVQPPYSAGQRPPPLPTPSTKEAAYSAMWKRTSPRHRLDQQRLHISGHTPLQEVRYEKELGYIQIDTACVYGRCLTAYCPQVDSFFSVDSQTNWLR